MGGSKFGLATKCPGPSPLYSFFGFDGGVVTFGVDCQSVVYKVIRYFTSIIVVSNNDGFALDIFLSRFVAHV